LPLEKTRVEMMKNLYPIVNYLLSLIRIYQYPFLCIHKSISKLTFIVMKIFTSLFKEGYCAKEEESEGTSSGQVEFSEGTGLDEGEGINDVSEQIENEEQVLNKGDMEPQKDSKSDIKENEKGLEMENDF